MRILASAQGGVLGRLKLADDGVDFVLENTGRPVRQSRSRPGAVLALGTRPIERLATELHGSVQWSFEPTGVVCEIDAPLDSVGGVVKKPGRSAPQTIAATADSRPDRPTTVARLIRVWSCGHSRYARGRTRRHMRG